jgi:hypothetical protein
MESDRKAEAGDDDAHNNDRAVVRPACRLEASPVESLPFPPPADPDAQAGRGRDPG